MGPVPPGVFIQSLHYNDISAVLAEHLVVREQSQRLGQRLRQQHSIEGIAMQGGELMHLGGMFAAHRQYPQTRRLQGIKDGARILLLALLPATRLKGEVT